MAPGPAGWRAAVTIVGFRTHRGPPGEPHALSLPEWTALNAKGRPFPKPRHAEASVDAPAPEVSTARPPAGRCSNRQAAAIDGLKAIAARVIRGKPRHQPPLDGPAFTSCAETTFTLHGSTFTAVVLINASHPNRPAAALPGARAKTAGPRVVEIDTGTRQAPPTHLFRRHILTETGPIAARKDGTACSPSKAAPPAGAPPRLIGKATFEKAVSGSQAATPPPSRSISPWPMVSQ